MRATISKILTGSLIAGAALAVSACGPKTETTTENTMVTDMNSTDESRISSCGPSGARKHNSSTVW